MKGPTKRLSLRSKLHLSKTEIQEQVKYIYQNELEILEWFPEHVEKNVGLPKSNNWVI